MGLRLTLNIHYYICKLILERTVSCIILLMNALLFKMIKGGEHLVIVSKGVWLDGNG